MDSAQSPQGVRPIPQDVEACPTKSQGQEAVVVFDADEKRENEK